MHKFLSHKLDIPVPVDFVVPSLKRVPTVIDDCRKWIHSNYLLLEQSVQHTFSYPLAPDIDVSLILR